MAVGVHIGGNITLSLRSRVTVCVSHTGGLAGVGFSVAVILGFTVIVFLAAAQMSCAYRLRVGTIGISSTSFKHLL